MDKPKPEADDADIAQAFLATPDAARKLMPAQIAKDLRTVTSPLAMTRGRMDGRYGLFVIALICALTLVVPTIAVFHDVMGLPAVIAHRGDWIPMAAFEIGLLAAVAELILKRGAQRRIRKFAAGQCIHCGYNLVATPDRCPECGNKPYAG